LEVFLHKNAQFSVFIRQKKAITRKKDVDESKQTINLFDFLKMKFKLIYS